MNNKKHFEEPQMDVILLAEDDVIATSSGFDPAELEEIPD